MASRYLGTCLDFLQGEPLGSYHVEAGPLREGLIDFAFRCVSALGLRDGIFHLEAIAAPDGGWCFLEVGARLGGGEIPFVAKDLFGIDLLGEWLDILAGAPPRPIPARPPGYGGFLLVPVPAAAPCRVLDRTSLVGQIPQLYAELLPAVGETLRPHGGYDRIGGRFRFTGASAGEVAAAIERARVLYRVEWEPASEKAA
jgi:hypothetical protein